MLFLTGGTLLHWKPQLQNSICPLLWLGLLVSYVKRSFSTGSSLRLLSWRILFPFLFYRIWIFSRKNVYLTLFLILGCLASLGLDITLTAFFIRSLPVATFVKHTPLVLTRFSIGVGSKHLIFLKFLPRRDKAHQCEYSIADLIMTGLLCYFLEKGRSGFPEYAFI